MIEKQSIVLQAFPWERFPTSHYQINNWPSRIQVNWALTEHRCFSSERFLIMQRRLLSHFSRVWLFATPWTIARQVPLSMDFQARTLEWVAVSFFIREQTPAYLAGVGRGEGAGYNGRKGKARPYSFLGNERKMEKKRKDEESGMSLGSHWRPMLSGELT